MKKVQFKLDDTSNISQIEKFRKIHPLATKGLSDEEVVQLGDAITSIHDDETPRKFKDVFTDENGKRYVIVNDGTKDVAIALMQSERKE
ncbi:MAG: hypothetical protein CSA86_01795 [Arcobacter sp.]|nr:MAG: hypothetical protein CSA86_01795 [Arcobacter sp.]